MNSRRNSPLSAGKASPAAASPWRGNRERLRDRELKRDAVIRAAAREFNRKGYHNTSLDEIAARLEVTKPTVYYYVTSKEQLLFECFVAGVEQIRAAFRAVRELAVPARERLNAVLRHYGEAVASEFGWCMVRAEDQDLSPAMSRHIKSLKSEIDQGIRRLIREGIQDGSIQPCDPKMTAFALAGALNWIAHWYREDQSLTPAQIAEAFVTVFEGGLRPRRGALQMSSSYPPNAPPSGRSSAPFHPFPPYSSVAPPSRLRSRRGASQHPTCRKSSWVACCRRTSVRRPRGRQRSGPECRLGCPPRPSTRCAAQGSRR